MRTKHLLLFALLLGFVTCQKDESLKNQNLDENILDDLTMAPEFYD